MNRPKRSSIIWRIIALIAALIAITMLVRLSGTDSIAVHLYYLPIIYAGYYFGDYGAILASLLASFLCGPFMPARYTDQGEFVRQEPATILVRMCMFYVVGLAASKAALELKRRASEAQHLYEVAHSITGSLRLNEVLDLITASAVDVMNAKACSIRLLEQDTGELVPAAMSGLSDDYWNKGKVSPEESPVDRRALQGEPVQILDVTENGFQYPEAAREEGITSVLTVPLREKEETSGVIRVYARHRRRFSDREIELLHAFADQAAVAIENARLYEDIRKNYYETVKALTTAVEARDSATYNHSERVTELADRVAEAMGLSEQEREMLRFGSILHDIGKIGVQEEALDARYDDSEMTEQVFYRMHPLIGTSILQPIGFLQDVLPVVKYHHEAWDGSGFPEGLQGKEIPLYARIVAVVDSYDRLQNPTAGERNAMSTREAVSEIVAEAGTKFDPEIVGKFHKLIIGTSDELDTGDVEQLEETGDEPDDDSEEASAAPAEKAND